MTVAEVLALLDAERGERGASSRSQTGEMTAGMRSFGIGLTRLRALARRIGRSRQLAVALWKSDLYEARVLALLVDDPAQITREQAERRPARTTSSRTSIESRSRSERSRHGSACPWEQR